MRTFTRNQWLLLRMALYLAIIVALYLWRGGIDWQRARVLMSAGEPARELRLAGRDLAPALVDSLLSAYARDYPEQGVALLPGGADLALEHLLNGRCELAFQTSPPTAHVQALARGALGDTLDWQPIALGALEIWSAAPAPPRLDLASLRALVAGDSLPGVGLLVAEAPTQGSWDAFARALGLDPEAAAASPRVLFLESAAAVLASLALRPDALGLLGGFALPAAAGPARALPVAAAEAAAAHLPERTAVASGDYPLPVFLYLCHREDASVETAKLVTHLTSPRGQRQIERAGFLPARRVLREVLLRRDSPHR